MSSIRYSRRDSISEVCTRIAASRRREVWIVNERRKVRRRWGPKGEVCELGDDRRSGDGKGGRGR